MISSRLRLAVFTFDRTAGTTSLARSLNPQT
jgi:hypothetical protein